MKKNILAFTYFLVVLFGAIPLFGMDSKISKRSKGSRAFYKARNKRVIKAINAIKKGGVVKLKSPFLSDKGVVGALCKAANRDVTTEVHVASRAKANQERLEKAGVSVKVVPKLHAKMCITSNQNPKSKKRKRGGENKSRVIVGSDNLSDCSRSNREVMVETKNDPEYFKQNYDLFKSPDTSKTKKKKVLKFTPIRRSIKSSHDCHLNESKGRRFRKLAEQQGSGNSVDITSMTFDSDPMVSEVEDMYEKCGKENRPKTRFILDRSALNHRDLLKRVKDAGGDDVSVYIFNEDRSKKVFGNIPQIQHTKTMTRKIGDDGDGDEYLSVVSTGNWTEQSGGKKNPELNVDSYHPGDKRLFDQIRANNDKLIKECEEYTGS